MGYTIAEIAEHTEGKILQQPHPNSPIRHLFLDSRKITEAPQSLFFAIEGDRWDGHQFLEDVYSQGGQNFIVSEQVDKEKFPEANIIQVDDTLTALQKLGAYHRSQYDLPVVGITGSNGKTTVKEWLYQLVAPDQPTVRSPKSYNSQVGVPLSVWQIDEHHKLGLFEAGISQSGEMERLTPIIQPTIGIFTNVGAAHDEGFKNRTQKIKEKLRLFTSVELLIYRQDYKKIHKAVQSKLSVPTLTWSTQSSDADVVVQTKKEPGKVTVQFKDQTFSFQLPYSDPAAVENALHCCIFMLHREVNPKTIQERLEQLSRIGMRLELKEAINNSSLINDSYNSDINSLRIALDFLEQQKQHQKRTVVLSDILQSGESPKTLYKTVSKLLSAKKINRLIGIGPKISQQHELFESPDLASTFYPSTEAFLKQFKQTDFSNETILLKGARAFAFEKIGQLLERQVHETVLEIDLNKMVDNLNFFRSRLKPSTKIMVMVKAFSYGSGSYEIANVLQFNKVDYLAVAYADGGIELREAGITTPIMVMNPEPSSFEALIRYRLEPEIYSFKLLEAFEQAVGTSIETIDRSFPVHIKLDTGMHRLGFDASQLDQLANRLCSSDVLQAKSIFSHLAAADEPGHDAFTQQQIDRYETMSNKLRKSLSYPFIRHILNTSGMIRFPKAQYDMVRLGIGLYGVDLTGEVSDQLQQVSTLKTTIAQIRNVSAGETVGYSRSGKIKRKTRIGVVNIGYADGLDRHLGNGKGRMLVNGKPAPIIGNICMDMCMIDLTDIAAEEGDEVLVFGPSLPIEQLADQIGTIPYEVLTNVSQRVKRIYQYE